MEALRNLTSPSGPVALVLTERLRPVAGPASVIFPPTYAPDPEERGAKSGYNIDRFSDAPNRCVIDSVQSQANRIEERFLSPPYSELVPQVTITAGAKSVNLLEASHRLADAAARFSALSGRVDEAFARFLKTRDASGIAKLSPMSIVFGAWDSRGTEAKLPRLVGSTIYAEDVLELHRSSQFNASFTADDLPAAAAADAAGADERKWSQAGLADAPGQARGGVIVRGRIMREAVLNLIALRHLRGDADETTARLQDYVLGLALVCISFPQDYDLRSGCHLVRDGRDAVDAKAVHRDGRQEAFEISHDQALEFAKAAAGRFAFEKTLRVEFDPAKATAYLAERGAKAQGPKKARTSRA